MVHENSLKEARDALAKTRIFAPMIGSPELDVDGLTAGGEAVPLLRGGAWQV